MIAKIANRSSTFSRLNQLNCLFGKSWSYDRTWYNTELFHVLYTTIDKKVGPVFLFTLIKVCQVFFLCVDPNILRLTALPETEVMHPMSWDTSLTCF